MKKGPSGKLATAIEQLICHDNLMNKNMRKDKHATPYYIDVIFSI